MLLEVSEAWTTRDARSGSRTDLLWMARFLMWHFHVGAYALPWDADEWVECPCCFDVFTRDNLLWDCQLLSKERQRLLLRVDSVRGLCHLALYHGSRLGQYLRVARRLLEVVRVSMGHEQLEASVLAWSWH